MSLTTAAPAAGTQKPSTKPLASGALDRLADAHIGAAAADIAGHCGIDIGIVGIGRCGQERRCRHDLPRLAIAALNHFDIEPRLLHFRPDRRVADRFDGRDRAVADRTRRQKAGAYRLAVDMHGAGAAQGHAATKFGAGQAQYIPQHPEQRHIGRNINGNCPAIDAELKRHGIPPLRRRPCRHGHTPADCDLHAPTRRA
jgi:hypothetical protein